MNYKNLLIFLSTLTYCLSNAAISQKVIAPKSFSGLKNYKELRTMADYQAIMNSPKPQILKLDTGSCGACKTMEPVFNDIAGEKSMLADFSTVNVDNEPFKSLIEKHSLESVPTTLYLRSGKEVKRDIGSMTKSDFGNQIRSFVKSN